MGKNNFNDKFDLILDASDKNFVRDLWKALGIKHGETVNIITPQFERTDGRVVTYLPNTPEEYAALSQMTPENLRKIGCQVWSEENGKRLWLYPVEWYERIPDGTEIITINGTVKKFEAGVSDPDRRCGALAYGFTQVIQ